MRLLRAGSETWVASGAGDLVFQGDRLRPSRTPASIAYCPTRELVSLNPPVEILVKASRSPASAKGSSRTLPVCFLPEVRHAAYPPRQLFGVSMTRGEKPPSPVLPVDKLAPNVRGELAPAEAELTRNSNDPVALISSAAILERYGYFANALARYRKLATVLPNALFLKAKIFEMEEAIADSEAAVRPAEGKRYAVVIGVSRFKRPEINLLFAASDARLMGDVFRSARLGLAGEDVMMLLDETATTAGIRSALRSQLEKAGRSDTVFIFLSGIGTVDLGKPQKGYVLGHDSDPEDLATTGFPMDELADVVEKYAARGARVILFVDVCHAGLIGTTLSTNINSFLTIRDPGEVLLLLASRPKELSIEGPQYGGGHGAFSYFLAKGLNGDADDNRDGAVDVDELVLYVRDQVAKSTGDKQHPRESGDLGGAYRLSVVTKPGISIK